MNHNDQNNKKENFTYNLLDIPDFSDEDCHRFDTLLESYPNFDPMNDIVLYPYLALKRMKRPEEPFAYEGKRCIVSGCAGNDSEEHHEHMLHVYLVIANFLRASYNLDRVSEVPSAYMQGVLTILIEILSPASPTFNKESIDLDTVNDALGKLSEQAPAVSEWMKSAGMVQYRAKHDDTKIENIESQEHLDKVIEDSALVMIDFWADWCGPCHALSPVLLDISHEKEDMVKVVKVNVDEQEEIAKKYGIESMPTVLFVNKVYQRDGGVIERHVGAKDKKFFVDRIEVAHKDGWTKITPLSENR